MEAATQTLARFLMQARQRGGLPEYMATDPDALRILRDFAPVNILASTMATTRDQGVLEFCRMVARELEPSDGLIIDVILNLDALPLSDAKLVRTLLLGQRRTHLLMMWHEYHEELGMAESRPRPGGDTSLRTNTEQDVLEVFAARLFACRGWSLEQIKQRRSNHPEPASTNDSKPGKVLVIGSAVMDVIFRLPSSGYPDPGQSVQVSAFELHPGGKGLTQAVAAARLGLDVWLAASIGDDEFGAQIQSFLEDNDVHTDLLKVTPGQTTPVTGVITYHQGMSVALGWKNDQNVRLTPEDVSSGAIGGQIQVSDFVLLTFEPPAATIDETIKTIGRLRSQGSTARLFVTPAPPLENGRTLIPGDTHAIDLLVANEWECQNLAHSLPGDAERQPTLEDLARRLLGQGVANVCVPAEGRCFVFTHHEDLAIPALPVIPHDSTGERDALVAALCLRLSRGETALTEDSLRWASAAMAAASLQPGVASAMPTVEDVERVMRNHSHTGAS